jgi:septal ring-binding cell division protein DamX
MIFILFLALLLILIATLAYPKYSLRKTHNSERKAEAEREARIKARMEKEEAGKTERMGCSERDDEEDDGDGGD